MGEALAYLAAGVTAAWGVAHIMPTGRVVAGFGNLSKDNRLILTMDWVAEGFTLVVLGVLVAVVTMRGGSADPVTQAVYAVAAGALLVFAVWTAATAARGSVIFFKICPVMKSLAAALLIAAIALWRGRLGGPPRSPIRTFRYVAGTPGPDHTFAFGDPAARVHQEGGVEHPWPSRSGFG